jgi:hypothetical protein
MIATAFSTNWGSRSSIQESKTVQAGPRGHPVRLENRADRALLGCAQTQLRMLSNVGGQIDDRPMGLPLPAQVSRFLTGEGDDLRLDRRVVEPWGRMMRTVDQSRQALGGEAGSPVLSCMTGDPLGPTHLN